MTKGTRRQRQAQKKKGDNKARKDLRKQGQTPPKNKRKSKKNKTVIKSVTDFTHALSHVTTKEETNQRLLMTKCKFPIIHSKIIDEETDLLKVRTTPLVIKRNNKVTCPRCKKKLDNFLVAFRKRRSRPIRNFFYRLSLVRLPKLNIRDKRREKKRLRLMANIEDQALDNFFDNVVKGIKDWSKFVQKHHKERNDEYQSLIIDGLEVDREEDEEILLDEDELVFDEDEENNDVSSEVRETKTEIETKALDDEKEQEFDNDQEEQDIEDQEQEEDDDTEEEQEEDVEVIDEGEEEKEKEKEED